MNQQAFDYIIVGAGSAGCVLADRLSVDPSNSVCLIEAGPEDRSALISTPMGLARLIGSPKYNWCYETEPQPQLGGRRLYWPRGKTLGGSSSINAMVYIRGHALDYDDWTEYGGSAWNGENMLRLFKEHEHNERGPSRYHGCGGPLNVADVRDPNPLNRLFIEAGKQRGLPHNPDFNGAEQEGVGFYQVTQKDGRRWSAARAFLDRARSRPNLTILTGARVTRIVVERQRATGVLLHRGGQVENLRARREVILSAGAVNSPHLLLLSGIGPRDELNRHGIPVLHELPGVGRNLQDHLDMTVMIRDRSRTAIGLALSFVPRAIIGLLRYLFARRGFLASNVAESGGFARLRKESERPEIQFHFLPTLLRDHGRKLVVGYGCTLHVCQLRPKSRGHIGLKSADPLADPLIQPNYLSHPDDVQELIQAVKLARSIFAAPAFGDVNGGEIEPGPHVQTDAQILEDIRKRAETIYHPVGTCRMGRDRMAVVDERLRVHGIEGLRVADASIMPTLIGGNTNAPCMVIGEMAARMILADRITDRTTSPATEIVAAVA
ncbi:choline dehydrogenase [Fontimonas thermophila]|uniref:Choline dehydrogenase n=1 Tax=Fontimonas thermophila TaxID=1076937 RepID=A0A1I2KMV5_9GAMM|nr:choline dehydrogenase [Fontimonas thermophila]SFF66451.1 choline dehydrogenase [Fontimonas thermophila]